MILVISSSKVKFGLNPSTDLSRFSGRVHDANFSRIYAASPPGESLRPTPKKIKTLHIRLISCQGGQYTKWLTSERTSIIICNGCTYNFS